MAIDLILLSDQQEPQSSFFPGSYHANRAKSDSTNCLVASDKKAQEEASTIYGFHLPMIIVSDSAGLKQEHMLQ
jgi:hypothetical protein